mgnify:CR=1 FL=1
MPRMDGWAVLEEARVVGELAKAGFKPRRTIKLALTCGDPETGCSQMRFSADNATWSTPETFSPSRSYTLAAGDVTDDRFPTNGITAFGAVDQQVVDHPAVRVQQVTVEALAGRVPARDQRAPRPAVCRGRLRLWRQPIPRG